MKRWYLATILMMSMTGSALAIDYPVDLSVNLVKPSNQPWLNLESCEAPDEVDLEISWSLETTPSWIGSLDGDIFLAADETCSSPLVEIDDVASEGVDVTIAEGQTTGQYPLVGDELTLADVTGLDCAGAVEHDYYFCIKFEYEFTSGITTDKYIYRGGTPIRFDVKRPAAPVIGSVSPGDTNLKINWTKPDDDDIAGYIIYVQAEGSADIQDYTETDEEATSDQITGLTNGVTYEVWMTAVDEGANESSDSNVVTGVPVPVQDFFEYYRGSGGSEDGGFCFVATAAYGSYQAAMVQPLRSFRDSVLAGSVLGRQIIAGYYQYGPRWARAIRNSDPHRAMARLTLAPAVAVAAASQTMGTGEWAVLLGAVLILLLLFGHSLKRLRRVLSRAAPPVMVAVVAAGLFLGSAQPARAQDDDADLKKSSDEELGIEPMFQAQIRFGPYAPSIDSESGLSGKPFKEVFGGGSEYMFELGLDYEVWRGFGTVAVGGSFGFVQYLGKGRTETGQVASDTTVLNLVPFRLNIGYHFDKIYEWFGVPLVPYLTGGFDYYIWWVLNGVGDVAEFEDEEGNSFTASGGVWGGHLNVGLKLLLDVLDQEAAINLEESVGIMNSYFFVEYAMSWIDQFGTSGHLNLSDKTFMFGLMMEF